MIALETRAIADLHVEVGEPIVIGETDVGLRRLIPILGGTMTGSGFAGRVLPGGVDYQLLHDDGLTTLEARYVVELEDGSRLYVDNAGIRTGPKEVMERLKRGEPVDPAHVYFRTTPRFETANPAYVWMMQRLFVASGIRRPDRVDLSVYVIE
jgi:hypothetical protein